MRTASVFCSSSDDVLLFLFRSGKTGTLFGRKWNPGVVEGLKHGLMGRLAQVAGKQGRVVGVIPETFNTEPVTIGRINSMLQRFV